MFVFFPKLRKVIFIFLFGLFLKLRKSTFQEKKKIYGALMKPSESSCFKDTIEEFTLIVASCVIRARWSGEIQRFVLEFKAS